ncbi:Bifunctional polynucleotide phosphatase kinase [Lecanosticta acicola]|uniref:Bifunctional polynucleotide phosphatase kinase n=1 Tax=Lecanosticta acicola TaxID=111012 RepID=A0AAI9EB73_9PEZI|nr:Bifunctional polynucleotide phosphatase kinase [Lecanosticta acicola]
MASLKRTATTDRDISPPPSKRKAVGTTNSAVANFFKPASQKEPEKIVFHVLHDTLLVGRYENAHTATRPKPVKIAAFDFDGTLIKTKSGNSFARGADDWQWWDASVPAKIKQLSAEGYAVIVVSNQNGISLKSDKRSDTKSLSNFKQKISAVLKHFDLPITVYAATGVDHYRKPRTGMWEQMLADYGLEGAADVDHEKSIFVGDAAGREGDKAAKTRKDHSCSDRDFAANVGIPFHTPEEYFLGEEVKPFVRSFDPKAHLQATLRSRTDPSPVAFSKKNAVEIVLFCGSPGSGKSTFFWQHMQPLGYERVNQDILKTRDKCIKKATELIQGDTKAVVVDNTNADVETRAAWIGLAAKLKVPIRLVLFTAPAKLCEHNDTVRALSDGSKSHLNPEKRALLPKMAFTGFASRYREPHLEEGFQDITQVEFLFRGTEEDKARWEKYWIT